MLVVCGDAELGDEACLSHPARPGQQHDEAGARARPFPALPQPAVLGRPADERVPASALEFGRKRRGRVQERVVVEDPPFELLQLRRGLETELGGQARARAPVDLQGIDLPSAAVEREHEPRGEPVARRMRRDEALELGDQLRVTIEREFAIDTGLDRRQALLVDAPDGVLRERLERKVGQRLAAPEPVRGAQQSQAKLGIAALERGGAFAHQADADLRIELPRADRELISARDGSQTWPEWLERLAKPHHRDLEPLHRAPGVTPPDGLEQDFVGHPLSCVQQQKREQGALTVARQCDGGPAGSDPAVRDAWNDLAFSASQPLRARSWSNDLLHIGHQRLPTDQCSLRPRSADTPRIRVLVLTRAHTTRTRRRSQKWLAIDERPLHIRKDCVNNLHDCCESRVGLACVSPNSWLAVDGGTTPTVRAQELRFAWERFHGRRRREDPELVREAITDSWRRSQRRRGRSHGRPQGADRRRRGARRTSASRSTRSPRAPPLIHECLSAIADEAGYLIVVSRRQRHADDDRGHLAACACARRAT